MSNDPLEPGVIQEYQAVANEVKKFVSEKTIILSNLPKYRGVQILYSGLHFKPKFMFIGINPGAGYYNNNGKNVEKYEIQNELEYLEETYKLGEETKKLFELANCPEHLETAVKTNWVYLATPNKSDLDQLLRTLLYEHKTNLYMIADAWTKRLIDAIQPTIIICEGKSAFDRVTWNVISHPYAQFDNLGYLKYDNTHVIGYRRNKFGGIINKEIVAAKIKEIVFNNQEIAMSET